MPNVTAKVRQFVEELRAPSRRRGRQALCQRLAHALEWAGDGARTEPVPTSGLPAKGVKAFLFEEPAAVFFGDSRHAVRDSLDVAALYAYHASIQWGIVADEDGFVIFNSHQVRNEDWFRFPTAKWATRGRSLAMLAAASPSGLAEGSLKRIATDLYEPDRLLTPVDDALVEKLDAWRDEVLRHVKDPSGVDEKLQALFAQLFVLRAVEDRRLAPHLPSLKEAVNEAGEADLSRLMSTFSAARDEIQTELFDGTDLSGIPPFVLGGIIRDLYRPAHLPGDAQYNFAWMDADVLGLAYEKYLSALLVPSGRVPPQLRLWNQPLREVDRVPARKRSGAYYTPAFLVRYLTERGIDRYWEAGDTERLPTVADISCGSGSFLLAAIDSLVRRLRHRDPKRNWGRELVEQKHILGIDVDPRAVTLAKLSLWLRLAEEPDPLPLPRLAQVVVQGDSLSDNVQSKQSSSCDIVLGNPPFIPLGAIHDRERLSDRFRSAQGRFDYSYLFVEAATERLRAGGVVALVVPNRLFRNRDAGIIRGILTAETELLSLVDFGANEVFSGVSSYVGTVIARKARLDAKGAPGKTRFMRVAQLRPYLRSAMLLSADRQQGEISDQYMIAYDTAEPSGRDPWLFISKSARVARVRLEGASENLAALAGIYQGIKTGANDVFVVEVTESTDDVSHVRNGFGDSHMIETSVLRPTVYGSDIQRYDVVAPERYLVYPYRGNSRVSESQMQQGLPRTFRYLASYRDVLAGRRSVVSGSIDWYDIERRRDAAWLDSRKLLIRDLATETSFALDSDGGVYLVGGTAVVPTDPDLLLPLLAYLNSRFANWYLSFMSPAFRADFQKFEPQHLGRIPVPPDVVEGCLRDRLAQLCRQVIQARRVGDAHGELESELAIDGALSDAVGIELSEIR